MNAKLLGISFCWRAGEAYYLNLKNENSKLQKNLFKTEENNNRPEWLEKLKPLFADDSIKKYGHNIKFDMEVLSSQGVIVNNVAADSMIAAYVLNSGSRQHNLDALAFSEFNHQKITKEDLLGKGKEKLEFSAVPLDRLYNYSCEDADFTFRLIKKLLPALKKEKLDKLYYDIEMPLVPVLAGMEENGILINAGYLDVLKKETGKNIAGLEKRIYRSAGVEFNINSTQQLQEVLFTKLGLSAAGITKTKTGISTGAAELEKMKNEHPIIILIQEYRELAKLQSTYIEALPALADPKTGRLHTSYNQSVTATGRLSSTEPNLQNIPIRTDLGRKIRSAFVAGKGRKLLSLDYSQIELRLAAHMSADQKMIKAFRDGADIHRATAAEINRIPLNAVDAELRRQAKAINFGILYGQGPHGLSQAADIPYARAKEFIDQYFSVYKDVKAWIDLNIEIAREKGYVETLFGRKRFLPEINSTALQIRKAAERMATNAPLQGTAADMIKIAMIRVDKYIKKHSPRNDIKMLLQVHDELLFEVEGTLVKQRAGEIKKIMENVMKLKVPIIVDAKAGENWGEMETIKN
jgi:DNA polymerase-1